MHALSRPQQQLIIGEVAWIVLDLYAASLARARSGECAMGTGEAQPLTGASWPHGRFGEDSPGASALPAAP
ncbi:MAG: hypothetical protein IPL06_19450 [Betaproteobacteria bacterium]|nr:hypothetical protein [Betaproteobacteria bacterium]